MKDCKVRLITLVFASLLVVASASAAPRTGTFEQFDQRATAGATLRVVFFGGSLTWGANASDPQRTSYRALMSKYLRERYPRSSFNFVDAAIGGTGSKLGLFRLDRDVLSPVPDLVFLDFTANDGLFENDTPTMASYERILRDLIARGVPVEQVVLGFKDNFSNAHAPFDKVLRRTEHLRLAAAYGTAVGDSFPLIERRVSGGQSVDELWPIDGAHPDDAGYQLFYEAVRDGFDQAVQDRRTQQIPTATVFEDAYPTRRRLTLVDQPLVDGWQRGRTYRTSLWFDGLSSRWMGDVAFCRAADRAKVKPIRIPFEGTLVGVFGEADHDGLSFRVMIDGKAVPPPNAGLADGDAWQFNTKPFGGGRLFMWRELSDSLSPGPHELMIEPVFPAPNGNGDALIGELRIESICTAGRTEKPK